MNEYKATIGLEIHAELKTKTKMFCNSINDPEEKTPNVNICPVCMAHPGTLPVVNKEAIKHVIKVGIALGGNVADFTEFDRKNYFYPDIPKGYQISQYKYPLISGGKLNGIEITRVHLEEDTAKSNHEKGDYSLIDFNRAGVPLMELVTEPVLHTAEEASSFAKELQLLLRYLGAGDANMEKGEMRVEANISVSKTNIFGTKVEVKNLNSFKVVEKAIEYEIKRQSELLEEGGVVKQETRGWDENKQETFSQREKESSHDYRYFPDPDIPKFKLSEVPELAKDVIQKEMPELPWEKRNRLVKDYGLKKDSAEIFIYDRELAKFFEETVAENKGDLNFANLASNYITSDLVSMMKNEGGVSKVSSSEFSKLIKMITENKVSSRGAKDILSIMFKDGGNPEDIATKNGLLQESNSEKLKEVVQKLIDNNPTVVAEYKSGKESLIQFFVGQGMKETKGSANPEMLKNLLKEMMG